MLLTLYSARVAQQDLKKNAHTVQDFTEIIMPEGLKHNIA